jgi:hypothetical protein
MLAVTLYPPAVALAVNAGAVAIPLLLVIAVAVADDPNNALAPFDGDVNVTVTPLTGFPPASLTVAWSAVVNAALMAAVCGVPAVAVMLAGALAVFVRLKPVVVARPAMLAVTL